MVSETESSGKPDPREPARDPGQGALRHGQHRLLLRSSVFLAASDPIVLEDLQRRITDLNEAAEREYGWTRSELIGRSVKSLIAPADHERADRARERCLRREEQENVLWTRIRKSGEHVPIALSLFPVPDESGAIVAIASIAKDVSALRRQEEMRTALRRAEERAEVRERRELARDLHDSVGQLLTLARLRVAELLDRSQDDVRKPVEELADVIQEAEERIRTVTFRVNPTSLHHLGLAAAAEELVEDLEDRYGMRVTVEEQGDAAPLEEEIRVALFRGLRELLINVARHAKTDEARIRIGVSRGHAVVSVEDDGVGFDPDLPTPGFGLFGLRDRLERCGGRLELESVPGAGTRARMEAPLSAMREDAP